MSILRLIAPLGLLFNGCAPCPQVECDDLINVVFAEAVAGDYSIEFDGETLECSSGTPSAEPLIACDDAGFLLRSGATSISLTVVGDGWDSSLDEQALSREGLKLTDRPECPVGCSRAEVSLDLD